VVSGVNFSMTFLLLCIQSTVCVCCVSIVKFLGLITFRDFDAKEAREWFPISFLLVSVIYTGSKSLVSPSCAFKRWCGGKFDTVVG
jgi:GDP-mannose transporter